MKFSDIKPYIQMNGYSVNSTLRYLPTTIKEYQDDLGLDLNPDFQRGYVWSVLQQERYIEHFLRGGTSGLDIYFNHTNWHKTKGNGDGWFVCVDGLQRLTACLGFMDSKVKAFGHYYHEFEDRLSTTLTLRLHINSLQTRKEVLEWYLQMNSGGTIHSEEELTRVEELLAAESR
ncbi:DUF262 domain-containing protein [Paenibacillus sp. N1-5-1-14]|uniref:DUF262 domain-containing protein n=1 Tax=Paenibacillus radicibacter TaxID=2972488 RepID=UPI002159B0B1|nr:DUF262 domain-containing protein [Paenibacillus radicibacter]MCR8641496.1 DUF262 domain-containing protein [Paenibacillus radicibacter]